MPCLTQLVRVSTWILTDVPGIEGLGKGDDEGAVEGAIGLLVARLTKASRTKNPRVPRGTNGVSAV